MCALSEHVTGLLRDTDESGSPAQLFELGGTNVGAGGAKAPQHVTDGVLHISSVGNLHCPPLRCPKDRILYLLMLQIHYQNKTNFHC